MRILVERLRRHLPGRLPQDAPDPFATLALQDRLARLAREIRSLESESQRRFGAGHHARAAELAYEQTLDEACRLIGAPVESGPTHRLMAEARLLHAGWTW